MFLALANYYGQHNQGVINNRKLWLLSSALLIALGTALVFAGNVHLFFDDVLYQYHSHGVVLEGEPKEIFSNPHRFLSRGVRSEDQAAFNKELAAITARTNEMYLLLKGNRGSVFNEPVTGGSRTYYFQGEMVIDPWQSKLIVFIGIFMLVLGVTGIFLERKLSGPRI